MSRRSWAIVTPEFNELFVRTFLFISFSNRLMRAFLQQFFRNRSSLLRSIVLFVLIFPPLLVLATALTLTVWMMPNIERYHQFIESQASLAIGSPIKIETITADWSGANPRLRLENIRILDRQGSAVLILPRVESVLSWRTLFFGGVRLRSMRLDQAALSIRRDTHGVISVAGINIDDQKDSGGADWLLQQGHLTIANAHLRWLDETRSSAILPLKNVNFELENRGDRHVFSLTATPPDFLSDPIKVHGKLTGRHIADVGKWQGEAEIQLNRFDALAWSYWLPLPSQFKRATGHFHGLLNIDRQGLRKVTVDLAVREVENRFAENLPALNINELNGRLIWQELMGGFELSGNKLSFALTDGFVLPPTNFSYRQQIDRATQATETALTVSEIDLASAQNLLAYLPLDAIRRQQIVEANPQGHLQEFKLSWLGQPNDFKRYQFAAKFDGLALQQVGDQPGFSGLNGALSANEKHGSLSLQAQGLLINAPSQLLEPLRFDRFLVDVIWDKQDQGWLFQLTKAQIANSDLTGFASGRYWFDGKGLGVADVTAQLQRASVARAAWYIPKHLLGEQTHSWLQNGLLAGEATQFNLKLRGDLDHFPFPENRDGIFQITAKAHDVSIDYQAKWPKIEHANARLLIEGQRLEITSDKANIGTGEVQDVIVTLPDMLSDQMSLKVAGVSSGTTQSVLNYINSSPLRAILKDFTKPIKVIGNGKLDLLLDIPLNGSADIKLQGAYHFKDNEVDLADYIPTLKKVNGDLLFTEKTLETSNMLVQALGGVAKILVNTASDGRLNVAANGRINADSSPFTVPMSALKRLYGGANWTAKVSVLGDDLSVNVNSDLVGLGAELPVPLAKNRHESVPVNFEMKNLSKIKDQISLKYGKVLKAVLIRQVDDQGNWAIKRGNIHLGHPVAEQTERDGIWITGLLPYISAQDWLALGLTDNHGMAHHQLPTIAGVDVSIRKCHVFNSDFNDLNIRGQFSGEVFNAKVNADELKGDLQWQAQNEGHLQLRLKEAVLGNAGKMATASQTLPASAAEQVATPRRISLPVIDVVVDQFSYQHNSLGKLEFHVSQNGQDVLLDHLRVVNPDGALVATGKWDLNSAQTHVNFKLDIVDAGKVLDRSGYPGSLRGASGSLNSDLLWKGGPDEFDQSSLSGSLGLKVGKGQFLKINPGAGKLLSVLNLQALPKRVVMDFTDVFSGGFEFDTIEATAQINQGVLVTKDLVIEGSSAKVEMAGQVDLKRETQNLRVRILPKLSNSVSLIAFAGGPVVGAGVLLASKVLSDPLDKLTSFEYNVTGNWADPSIVKVSD